MYSSQIFCVSFVFLFRALLYCKFLQDNWLLFMILWILRRLIGLRVKREDYQEPRWRRRKIEDRLAEAPSILRGGWRAGDIAQYFYTFRFVSKPVALLQNITGEHRRRTTRTVIRNDHSTPKYRREIVSRRIYREDLPWEDGTKVESAWLLEYRHWDASFPHDEDPGKSS